jgi:hypothetical protein
MIVAKIYPEPQKGKRTRSLLSKELNSGELSKARTVLEVLPEMAVARIQPAAKMGRGSKATRR